MASPLVNWVKRVSAGALGCMQVGRAPRQMQLLETLNLGGKRQLLLVVCDGKRYLIGAGGDGVHSIEEVRPTAGACGTAHSLYCQRDGGTVGLDARRLH